jgi:hypothetical protein
MRRILCSIVLLVAAAAPAQAGTALPADIVSRLESDPFVYISSTRKSGELGTPAEIWFAWDGSTLVVGTPPTSYRVRRIRAGRPQARIWVTGAGKGPWFDATGAVDDAPAAQESMIAAFRKKYGERFAGKWEENFRTGFKNGTRVLVRYTPTGKTGAAGEDGAAPASSKAK